MLSPKEISGGQQSPGNPLPRDHPISPWTPGKRKADQSCIKKDTTKRLALVNLTNNANVMPLHSDEEDEPNSNLLALAVSDPGRLLDLLRPCESEPLDVEDFDAQNWDNPFEVSDYAMEIFDYLKEREAEFPMADYMHRQVYLTTWKRALLVDWMMMVLDTLTMNHETLYLAVKIVDIYLCRLVINEKKLKLLGAAALLIACKYGDTMELLITDFLGFFDETCNKEELARMERDTLRFIDYDLGIPLSYSFLRRYARCADVPKSTFTLARYILDLSLMDYNTILFSGSQMAAAALFMALRMHGGVKQLDKQTWTPTLEHYTDYQLVEFATIVPVMNAQLHSKPEIIFKAIREKYSNKVFHKVAMVPLLTNQELFQSNLYASDLL